MAKDLTAEAMKAAQQVGKSQKTRKAGQVPGGPSRGKAFYVALQEVKETTPKTPQALLRKEAK